MADMEKMIIVGGGVAGYTAALYASRANMRPLVFEGAAWGGMLQETTAVENYPGFPEGIMGPEMMERFRTQAARFGAQLLSEDVERIELADGVGGVHKVYSGRNEYETQALVLAMGASYKKLGVPGEVELTGKGVSYCATCDAAFFRDDEVVVIGGGDTAMEEASFLSRFASKVTVLHRRDEFRATPVMLDRVNALENVELLTPYEAFEFVANEEGVLSSVKITDAVTGEEESIPAQGAFVAIGHEPRVELIGEQLELDDLGYVAARGRGTVTSRPGVFAAGELADSFYRQAVVAAGTGAQAVLDAEAYLQGLV